MIYYIDYKLKFIITESYPTRLESCPNRNIDYVYTAPLVRDLYNKYYDHTHE